MQTHLFEVIMSSLDLLAVLNLLGVVQGLFLSVVFLFNRRGNRVSGQLLGAILLVVSLIALDIFAGYTGLIVHAPFLINLTEPLEFLIGPLVYLYTLSLLNKLPRWPQTWVHALPALIYLILRLPYLLQSNAYKLQDTAQTFHQPSADLVKARPILWFPEFHFGGFWLDMLFFPLMVGYLLWCFRLIYRHVRSRNESLWAPSQPALRSLVRVLSGFGGFVFFAGLLSFWLDDDLGDIYISTVSSVLFYGASYRLIRNPALLESRTIEEERRKYTRSGLDEAATVAALQKLRLHMQTQKPHLNTSLTLPLLASQLHLSTHHLSQLLNESLKQSFPDFINGYRVDELKRRLTDPDLQHFKIEELAFESGFNSKSVFNTAFRKHTGTTPSQYRQGSDVYIRTPES